MLANQSLDPGSDININAGGSIGLANLLASSVKHIPALDYQKSSTGGKSLAYQRGSITEFQNSGIK